jgi:hypothetical protein
MSVHAQRSQGATGRRRSQPLRLIFCVATALALDAYGYLNSRSTGVSAAGQALSRDVAPAFVFHKLPTPSRRCGALRGPQAVCARVAEHPSVASQTKRQTLRPVTEIRVPTFVVVPEAGHHGDSGGLAEAGGARHGDLTPTLRLRPSELAVIKTGGDIKEEVKSTGPPPPCQETRRMFPTPVPKVHVRRKPNEHSPPCENSKRPEPGIARTISRLRPSPRSL